MWLNLFCILVRIKRFFHLPLPFFMALRPNFFSKTRIERSDSSHPCLSPLIKTRLWSPVGRRLIVPGYPSRSFMVHRACDGAALLDSAGIRPGRCQTPVQRDAREPVVKKWITYKQHKSTVDERRRRREDDGARTELLRLGRVTKPRALRPGALI